MPTFRRVLKMYKVYILYVQFLINGKNSLNHSYYYSGTKISAVEAINQLSTNVSTITKGMDKKEKEMINPVNRPRNKGVLSPTL